MDYIKTYYGVIVREKPDALKPVQVQVIDIEESSKGDDGTYYLPVVRRINGSMAMHLRYNGHSMEEAQKEFMGKGKTRYNCRLCYYYLYPNEILYFEADDYRCIVHTADKSNYYFSCSICNRRPKAVA